MLNIARIFARTSVVEDRFSQLFRPHIQDLYRTAYRWTQSPQSAEDLVQDLALRVIERVDEMAAVERLRPWLLKIMYRRFIDIHRRAVSNPVICEHCAPEGIPALEEQICDAGCPEKEFELDRLRQALEREINSLEPAQKAAVMLYDGEGYTIKEIAEIMNTTEGTVKSRLHRARSRLKKLLSLETFC